MPGPSCQKSLSPPKKDDNLDNKTPILSNNYIQQKGLFFSNISKEKNSLETSNTIKNKMETQTIPKNSINNVSIFNGKLIDVLNNEKNSISNTHNNVKSLNAAEKKEDITLSQKIQNFSAELNSINSNINNVSKSNNNINNTNTITSMKSFLFCQNISECIHDFNTVKEEKKIEKKIEKNDRMEVEESGETPPTQNSPNIKNSEINYAQTKIDEIKANLSTLISSKKR